MPDDLDDRDPVLDPALRRAMASLDGEAPAGYFDALPDRTLARLDDPAISGPIAALRDDEAVAELADIRSLASETRARLSSQRAAQGSLGDPDDAAAPSGVWKAVALPEPGKQVRPSRELAGGSAPALVAASAVDAGDATPSTEPGSAAARSPAPHAVAIASPPARSSDAGATAVPSPASPGGTSVAVTASSAAVEPVRGSAASAGASLVGASAASAGGSASPPIASSAAASLAGASAASSVGAAAVIASAARRGRRTQFAIAGLGLAAAAGAVLIATAPRDGEHPTTTVAAERATASSTPGAGSAAAPPIAAPSPPVVVAPPSPHAAPARPSSSGDFATGPKPGDAASGKRSGDAKPSKKGSGRANSSLDLFGESRGGVKPSETRRPRPTKADAPAAKPADPAANQGAPRPSSDGAGAGGPAGTPGDGGTSDGASTATAGGKVEGAFQAGSGSGSGTGVRTEPSLDELLGEPSTPAPRTKAPRLERTSLSADDFKRGMAAVDARARACFAGTQGLASLRLTVAPSGRVTSATVSGMFAGSPVGACVERAVRAAKFPAWDGRPQRFSYSYLLSD